MTRIQVVNEHDDLIEYREKQFLSPHEFHRVSAAWLESPEGEVLLARRANNKRTDAGKRTVAAAGTLEDDDTYETNISKELYEELGLQNLRLRPAAKLVLRGQNNIVVQFFRGTLNRETPLIPRAGEVAEIRWFSKREARLQWEQHPETFASNFGSIARAFLEEAK
jgi:isopentenyldiphosphate isomerase